MHLDLSSLEKATDALRQTLGVAVDMARSHPGDKALHNALRAGIVQTFEFTYELSWKFMKRWIEDNVGASQVDGVPRRELFRLTALRERND